MTQMKTEEFKFPDETDETAQNAEPEFEIEVVEDELEPNQLNKDPMPKEIVDEIDQDDLEAYSDAAKQRLKQLKKVWNDERRRADAAESDQKEALRVAQAIIDENKRLKGRLFEGEKSLVSSYKENVASAIEKAKQEYKDAYDSGDSDRLVEAQEKLTDVKLKAQQIEQYKPEFSEDTLQNPESNVQIQSQPQRLDSKTQSWLDKNKWYGVDDDMSYLAHGVHRRMEREGVPIGSDFYWSTIDNEMRKRFPDKFEESEDGKNSSNAEAKTTAKNSKPATVVAPATRSTSPKRVTLSLRQQALAKKLNLTNEQYARELTKLESQNG
jgi:hypothetical protein